MGFTGTAGSVVAVVQPGRVVSISQHVASLAALQLLAALHELLAALWDIGCDRNLGVAHLCSPGGGGRGGGWEAGKRGRRNAARAWASSSTTQLFEPLFCTKIIQSIRSEFPVTTKRPTG